MMQQLLKRSLRTGLLIAGMLVAGAAHAVVVKDIAGRTVTVPDNVQRVLLGEGRLFYAMSLLEGKQPFARIAGWQGDFRLLDKQSYAEYRKRFPQIDQIPLIGHTSESSVSAEKILTLKPDLAIFSTTGHGPGLDNPIVQQLSKAGVPVVFVDFRQKPLEDSVPSMRVMGQALGRSKQAEAFIKFYQDKLAAIKARVANVPTSQRPWVFVDVRAGMFPNLMTAGNGSFGEMVELAGGRNLGGDLLNTPLGQVNIENVLMRKPTYYLATGTSSPDDMNGVKMGAAVNPSQALTSLAVMGMRDQLKGLSAARSNHTFAGWHMFYVIPQHIVLIEAMAKWLHPEQFKDVDPAKTWAEMHQRFNEQNIGGTYWVSHP